MFEKLTVIQVKKFPALFLEMNIYNHIHKQTVSGIYAEPDKSSSCPPTPFLLRSTKCFIFQVYKSSTVLQ